MRISFRIRGGDLAVCGKEIAKNCVSSIYLPVESFKKEKRTESISSTHGVRYLCTHKNRAAVNLGGLR